MSHLDNQNPSEKDLIAPSADTSAAQSPATSGDAEKPRHRPSREPRHSVPTQDGEARRHNFDEVALGFDDEQALAEANRCLQCRVPTCEQGCPVNVRIKDFIRGIIDQDLCEGVVALRDRNALPAVCGRVCPQETQCEAACILGKKNEPVNIGALERYLADWDRAKETELRCHIESAPQNGHKVAVVGSGPSGLACAGELNVLGYDVTVFESLHTAGGVLAYGIPEFRLPKSILADEVGALKDKGVKFAFNQVVGKITTAEELLEEGFEAVFLGTGAGLPVFLGIPGENFNGVYSANEYLTRVNLMRAYAFPNASTPVWRGNRIVVVGGGNVAMDAARTAVRLGALEVSLVYRRTEEEMPARREEIEHAKEEGVIIRELNAPLEIVGDQGWCAGLRVGKMRLGEPDESGRRRPIPIESSEEIIACDTVISAVGTRANTLTHEAAQSVEMNKYGYLVADEDGRTNHPRIFAGGDIVTGAATVILAMGAGKRAAHSIDEMIKAEL